MNLREMVAFGLKRGLRGEQVDRMAQSFGVNLLDPGEFMPAIAIKVGTWGDLETMARDGLPVLFSEGGVLRFSVIYPPDEGGFPIARVYHVRDLTDAGEAYQVQKDFRSKGLEFSPVFSPEFGVAIKDMGHRERVKTYVSEFVARDAGFRNILDGRVNSTFVERGIILSSKGCLQCGNEAGLLLSTFGADEGTLVGFYLCPDHLSAALEEKDGFIQYIAKSFGEPLNLRTFKPSQEFCLKAAMDVLVNQLGCAISKVDGDTITAQRPSQVRLVMRVTDLKDYAYMIFDPAGKQRKRIDSAPHHKIEHGPDHLHEAPTQKKHGIVPSYTYGFVPSDIKLVRKLVEELEAELGAT